MEAGRDTRDLHCRAVPPRCERGACGLERTSGRALFTLRTAENGIGMSLSIAILGGERENGSVDIRSLEFGEGVISRCREQMSPAGLGLQPEVAQQNTSFLGVLIPQKSDSSD